MHRISLIATDPQSAVYVETVLSMEGYEVSVLTPSDPLPDLAGAPPECLLLDVSGALAPGLITAGKQLFPQCSFVVLGSSTRLHHVIDSFDAGAEDYLRAPYDPRELAARLRVVASARAGKRPPAVPSTRREAPARPPATSVPTRSPVRIPRRSWSVRAGAPATAIEADRVANAPGVV